MTTSRRCAGARGIGFARSLSSTAPGGSRAPYSLAWLRDAVALVNVLYLIQNVLTSDKQTVYHSCARLKLDPIPFQTASRIYEDDRDGSTRGVSASG